MTDHTYIYVYMYIILFLKHIDSSNEEYLYL